MMPRRSHSENCFRVEVGRHVVERRGARPRDRSEFRHIGISEQSFDRSGKIRPPISVRDGRCHRATAGVLLAAMIASAISHHPSLAASCAIALSLR